jgi:hypothetical protein
MFSLLCLITCITSYPPSGGEEGEEGGRRREGTTVQLLGLIGGLVTSSGILPGIENRTSKNNLKTICASQNSAAFTTVLRFSSQY